MMLAILLAAAWQLRPPGFELGAPGISWKSGGPGGDTQSADADDELRIEIVETASEAEARYRQILERYGDDPTARAWVADCVADGATDESGGDFQSSWEYACWRSWSDHSAGRLP